MAQPKSWEECGSLIENPDIMRRVIRQRLLWLHLNTESTVATKAAEMLLTGPDDAPDVDLSGMTIEQLTYAKRKADLLLLREMQSEGAADGDTE